MKIYQHQFCGQVHALKYFMEILWGACQHGDWVGREVLDGFVQTIRGLDKLPDGQLSVEWPKVLGIIQHLDEVGRSGGRAMFTDFGCTLVLKQDGFLDGDCSWDGQFTRGRWIWIRFDGKGGVVMQYALGVRDGIELSSSGFLGLPKEGDKVILEETEKGVILPQEVLAEELALDENGYGIPAEPVPA